MTVVSLVKPRLDSIQLLKLQQQDLQAAIDNSRRLELKWNELVSRYNAFSQSDLEDAEGVIPSNVDNVKLIIELSELAKQVGVELRNVSLVDENSSDASVPYGTLSLGVTLRGTYANFVEYISQVESSLRLMDIRSVAFTPNEGEIDRTSGRLIVSDVYDYSIVLDTYWLR